jgi:predicted transcriptional regulator
MRAKYLGAQATEFVVSSYLRKKGFSKELSEIIKNDRRFRDSMKEMYEFSDYKDAQAYAQGIAQPPMLSGADKEYLNAS